MKLIGAVLHYIDAGKESMIYVELLRLWYNVEIMINVMLIYGNELILFQLKKTMA